MIGVPSDKTRHLAKPCRKRMNLYKRPVSFLVIPAFLALSLSTGCASFQQHQVPTVREFPLGSALADVSEKPSVRLIVTSHGYADKSDAKDLDPLIVKAVLIAEASSLFDSVLLPDDKVSTTVDYEIRVDLSSREREGMWVHPGVIVALPILLFILPFRLIDEHRLTAAIWDSGGNELRRYQYDDRVKTWTHFTLLPAVPFASRKRVNQKAMDNMLKRFFNDIARDFSSIRSRE